ncbi:MAG: hypothetical protein Q8K54_07035 [Gallionella sp.]|jgi:hypothetical protein|nr:hypothetical protein [Gallionella sp.]
MRITVNYFEGHSELQADLSALPLRARAERLRMLASMGLSVLGGKIVHVDVARVAPVVGGGGAAVVKTSLEPVPGQPETERAATQTIVKSVFGQF